MMSTVRKQAFSYSYVCKAVILIRLLRYVCRQATLLLCPTVLS